jgi:hypothetical protein
MDSTSSSQTVQIGPEIGGYNISDRFALIESHPIREREYIIPTQALERTYNIIRDRVWTRRTGICFYAPPQSGKSTAASYVHDRLIEEFETVVIDRVNARSSGRASLGHMFRLILECRNHQLSVRCDADKLLTNVVSDISLAVKQKRGTQYVLIIDEMHLLSPFDLQQLVVAQNALYSDVGCRLTAVSFAQPEILQRRSGMITAKQHQLIARYLSEPVLFETCASAEELRAMLKTYDEYSEFPSGSGWSYTMFFVPQAFRNGFRLYSYAEKIWGALMLAAKAIPEGLVPMEHLSLTIEFCLLAAFEHDAPNFNLSDGDIKAAVASSNLSQFCAA